jgi:folate-binding protein YgfZ
LLSNDLVAPGDGSMVYSALLTPKGMITADMWVLRLLPQRLLILPDTSARGSMLGVFSRSIPPRMARVEDRSRERETLWVCGDLSIVALAAAGITVPDGEGRVISHKHGDEETLVARPHAGAHFRAVLVARPEAIERAMAGLAQAGAVPGDLEDLEAVRILAGWPRLGAEIQEKTLPQEVRYDALQGVSYTKGCYLGQETVARLHFRGHTNRELRGLVWTGVPALDDDTVLGTDGQNLGTIGSRLVLPKVTLGLALLRREVNPGDLVSTGGQYARVVQLPFAALASFV